MNRGRWILLWLLATGGLAGAVALAWFGDREPEYKGRRLSAWVELYEDSFLPLHPDEDAPQASEVRREAVEAARQMKDKILPRASRLIASQKPQWKSRVENVMEMRLDVRSWCPVWIWKPFFGDRGEDSLVYFDMLGPDAGPAVPDLVRVMKRADTPRIRERAMYALACIGKEGLRPLMEVLGDAENPDRRSAAYAFLQMKRHAAVARPAVPLLTESLKDADRNVACAGAMVLGELALEAHIAVPALADCLQSPDEYLRREAAEALQKFGEKARSAVPAVSRALDDPDFSARQSATNALATIAPDALGRERTP